MERGGSRPPSARRGVAVRRGESRRPTARGIATILTRGEANGQALDRLALTATIRLAFDDFAHAGHRADHQKAARKQYQREQPPANAQT